MKKHLSTLLVFLAFVSCGNGGKQPVLIEGTVKEISPYGGLVPSFTPMQFDSTGVEYGDMLAIEIGDSIALSVPYIDAYTEVGCMSPCVCNYNRGNEEFGISFSCGSFVKHIGGRTGDRVVVKLKGKGAYLHEYSLLQGTYTYDRKDYESDEMFANFREVATTGIKPGRLYRGTSPINRGKNKVRFAYTDSLCRVSGIRTVIDIADSGKAVENFLLDEGRKNSYMREVLESGTIIGLGSGADFTDVRFLEGVERAMRGIIVNPGPYFIHCNEGKDRTGFYCILLEAFCGASVEEMKADYMQTFINLYHQQKGSETYELTWKLNGFRMLYLIANPQLWDNIMNIDWDKVSLGEYDLRKSAADYIRLAGLSAAELELLKEKLTL